jgi:hypothetical protein
MFFPALACIANNAEPLTATEWHQLAYQLVEGTVNSFFAVDFTHWGPRCSASPQITNYVAADVETP